ncbi:MAG TPA: hypothetical protein DEG17_10380 [Cyanobacteria bacterium UBA11149]|nr:hypothetical protein [Cyanobacteria bacterium UBA11366]HBK66859.1 hypothetical protein [Cyanobacteria bacterium UBA11166]HBW89255.1 hypothetical protein [Cyanobacteria bacterium UBA11149]HCA97826.1 hypothetical protein [Cyanobacteria bacterium UBA9226]
MLKLTYTENGFYLERLSNSLEEWVATRVTLSLRAGASIWVEPSTAAFLLPRDMPQLADLEKEVRQEEIEGITLSVCDADYLEVSLQGTWMTSNPDGEEGVFVASLCDSFGSGDSAYRLEFFLWKLWQESQSYSEGLGARG